MDRRELNGRKVPRLSAASDSDSKNLGDAIIDAYLANLHVVRALGREHGFTTLAYWQPIAFEKANLSQAEMQGTAGEQELREPFLFEFHKFRDMLAANAAMQSHALRIGYLGDFFNDPGWTGKSAFYDACHLTEDASQAVARRIADDVANLLAAPPPS